METMRAHSPEEVVWKWEIPLGDTYRLRVPRHTRFLPYTEVTADGVVSIWGIVHEGPQSSDAVIRRFHMRGTGQRFDSMVGAGYLATATVDTEGGQYVLHVFVDPDEAPIAGEGATP